MKFKLSILVLMVALSACGQTGTQNATTDTLQNADADTTQSGNSSTPAEQIENKTNDTMNTERNDNSGQPVNRGSELQGPKKGAGG